MTALLTEVFAELLKLPDERQNELAQMLMKVTEGDRLEARHLGALTAEQQAEVDAAIKDDRWVEEAALDKAFERLLG